MDNTDILHPVAAWNVKFTVFEYGSYDADILEI